jgi:hypothetical protein
MVGEIVGQQTRLKVALDFLPLEALPQTRRLAGLPRQELVEGKQLELARRELALAMQPPFSVFGRETGAAE